MAAVVGAAVATGAWVATVVAPVEGAVVAVAAGVQAASTMLATISRLKKANILRIVLLLIF